jgi:hypothetical protein
MGQMPPSRQISAAPNPSDAEREEVTALLREAARALKQGVDPGQVRAMLADLAMDDLEDDFEEDEPGIPEHIYALAESIMRVNPGMDGETALVQAEAIAASQQQISQAPVHHPSPNNPDGVRSLQPGEPMPPELQGLVENPGDRAKLERTMQRAHIASQRARMAQAAEQSVAVATPKAPMISEEQRAEIARLQAEEAQRHAERRNHVPHVVAQEEPEAPTNHVEAPKIVLNPDAPRAIES